MNVAVNGLGIRFAPRNAFWGAGSAPVLRPRDPRGGLSSFVMYLSCRVGPRLEPPNQFGTEGC